MENNDIKMKPLRKISLVLGGLSKIWLLAFKSDTNARERS